MGSGSYSVVSRSVRAEASGFYTAPIEQTFRSRSIPPEMDPNGVMLREARDSDEHPNSVPIIIGLDLTGSMGAIPGHLVKDGLPNMVSSIIQSGVADPQILFLGIGDHESDEAPLQVGQFESSDELLDKWLTTTWLEGRGGGNAGESYLLAWYFAATRTEHDAMAKRGKKGYLFTIGDEPTLNNIPERKLRQLFGAGQYSDVTAAELLKQASDKYHIYHIHTRETWNGSKDTTIEKWRELLQQNVIVVQDHSQVPGVISGIVAETEAAFDKDAVVGIPPTSAPNPNTDDAPTEQML